MPPLTLLIKPASSLCNLRCRYCFYQSIAESRTIQNFGLMSPVLLENLVKKALSYGDHVCTFGFQGGEPTLAGLDFYRLLIKLQKKYNQKNIQIFNTLQTNGILITEEWAKFLSENHFLVGLSLDGPKEIHDTQRLDANGKGTFNRVLNTARLFRRYQVEFNILTVVNRQVARHPAKVYQFFKRQGFRYLQFIPCLDPLAEEPGTYPHSLRPNDYDHFLINLFELWYQDVTQGDFFSIQMFDNYVEMIQGYPPEVCGLSGSCAVSFVIEGNGNVYPCDFYASDKWCLGNITISDFATLKETSLAQQFIESSKPLAPQCKSCQWYDLCQGGCRRYREPFRDEKPVLNYFCAAYQRFFEHSWEKLRKVAEMAHFQRY
ncbi:MAG TPA: anaerobic sulfatase maturase [Firmicutes bacterium]|jgi:uncharacterized protein|nr:anaerobic sulfatase maturase [Bacillota bacterium]